MKNTKQKILIVLSLGMLFSCGKDPKIKEETKQVLPPIQKEEIIEQAVDINSTDSKSEVIFTDANVQVVYTQYLGIKRGLVNSNAKLVSQEARKLELNIEESGATKQLKATAKLIALTKDINKQRDFFVTLTEEIAKLVSDASITSGEVYKQFCPMAFDGTGGYWLSDSKEIRNPYFGDRMLKCGSLQEAIQ